MRVVVVVVAAIAVAALAGCDLTPQGSAEGPPKDERVTTDVSRLNPTRIDVWLDTPEVATPLTKVFERDHPNIDVNIVTKSYEDHEVVRGSAQHRQAGALV